MPEETLKTKTITSMIWTAIQRFGVITLSFITNLILARILSADDFGIVGMISIFIFLAEAFTDSGLGEALINKKDCTDVDYSTVFWSNLALSVIIYLILFVTAPLIAKFYKMEVLTKLLRIKAIIIILQGLRLIQTTILQKQLNFKKISLIYLSSSIISTIISIILALNGWGYWALVAKTIIDITVRTFLFWIFSKWKPMLKFSIDSFKQLFSFGFVMLSASTINTLYSEGQGLIIGKAFTATDLGYYTQARKLQEIPTNAVIQIVNTVTFPVLSKLKEDIEKMKKAFQKIIISITYVTFPMMIFFIICAQPIFRMLYTSKWDFSIPYFRYLCIVGMMTSVNTINTTLVKSTGRKGLYFKFQVIEKIIGIIFLILSVRFGMSGLLIANVILEYLFFIINAIVTNKSIHYSIWEQIRDLLPNYLLSILLGILVYFGFTFLKIPNIVHFILEFFVYSLTYIGLSWLFRFKSFYVYKEIIISKVKKNKLNKNNAEELNN